MNEPIMIKFINRTTGTEMWVARERVDEYKAAGHILAADIGKRPKEAPAKVEEPAPVEEAPKKRVIRKKK